MSNFREFENKSGRVEFIFERRIKLTEKYMWEFHCFEHTDELKNYSLEEMDWIILNPKKYLKHFRNNLFLTSAFIVEHDNVYFKSKSFTQKA